MPEPLVASLALIAERRSGERTPLAVRIGMPVRGAASEWRCHIDVDGLAEPIDIHGADSLQALSLGLAMVATTLRRFVDGGGRLTSPDSSGADDWPIDAYFR